MSLAQTPHTELPQTETPQTEMPLAQTPQAETPLAQTAYTHELRHLSKKDLLVKSASMRFASL
ncbi:hypothetical protein PInf_016502 [Phytophthora infestans]|nr:hypothetical protein PInf_016502 [Phytophthora infestans]